MDISTSHTSAGWAPTPLLLRVAAESLLAFSVWLNCWVCVLKQLEGLEVEGTSPWPDL